VGHVAYPATNVSTITQTVTLLDYNTGLPVPGVDICLSYECATCGSMDQTFSTAPTDGNGFWRATLQLPAVSAFGGTGPSFQGCARFSGPDVVTEWGYDGFPQTNATWNISPAYAGTTLTSAELAMDTMTVGVSWDPSRAVISMRAFDCLGNPAAGVQVTSNTEASRTFFLSSGSSAATPVSAVTDNVTGSAGLAYFFNVPAPDAGSVDVDLTATPVGLGKASSHETVAVRAGVITSVQMTPTP
jgi:hypothetical protein